MGPTDSANTTPIAAIPTSAAIAPQHAQAAAGVDLLNYLKGQRQLVDSRIEEATKKALVPVSATGPGTSPGLLLTPVQPHQDSPMINRPTTGARSTRDKGIANTIIGAANLVGKYEFKAKQEKQRALAVDLERVLQSQQGITEAQQALQVNPNDAAAKATLDKNQRIIDSLLSDPRRRKDIGKALDINFTDPSQNNKPEHGAFKEAVNSYSKQLAEATPSNMTINPQAVAQLQLLQANQKSIDDMIKAVAGPAIRNQGAMDVQQLKSNTSLAETAAKIQSDMAKSQAEIQGRYKAAVDSATIKGRATIWVAQLRAQSAMNRMVNGLRLREQLRESRGLSSDKNLAAMQKSYQLALKANSQATQQINYLEQERKSADSSMTDTYNKNIQYWEHELKRTQDIMSNLEPQLSAKGAMISNESNESNTKSSRETSSSTQISTVGPTEDSDEVDDSDLFGTNSDNSEQ